MIKTKLGVIQNIINKNKDETAEIQDYFLRIAAAFNEQQRHELIPLSQLIDLSSYIQKTTRRGIGIPGTFGKTIDVLSQCYNMYLCLLTTEGMVLMKEISNVFSSIASIENDKITPIYSKLNLNCQTYGQIMNSLDLLSNTFAGIYQTFAHSTNEVNLTANKTLVKNFRGQFEELRKKREILVQPREDVMKRAQPLVEKFRNDTSELSDLFIERNTKLKNLFAWYADEFENMSGEMTALSSAMKTASENISFSGDFKDFIENRKIIRYDLYDIEFEEIDTSSPAFEGVGPTPQYDIKPISPVGMAKVLNDYVADGKNEISCKKGGSVLLMEFPEEDWCYVMNPSTHITGYLPSLCLEPFGRMIGLVIRDSQAYSSHTVKGDMISVLEDSNLTSYKAENAFGNRFDIPRSNVAIIYSQN